MWNKKTKKNLDLILKYLYTMLLLVRNKDRIYIIYIVLKLWVDSVWVHTVFNQFNNTTIEYLKTLPISCLL